MMELPSSNAVETSLPPREDESGIDSPLETWRSPLRVPEGSSRPRASPVMWLKDSRRTSVGAGERYASSTKTVRITVVGRFVARAHGSSGFSGIVGRRP
jgi:hypothetical protein